jgi:hypothetical protein
VTNEEKAELFELLAHRTRSPWEIRRERLIAAEARLGMWKNGSFTGEELTGLMERARLHPHTHFTRDESIVSNLGCSPEEVAARRREHGERQS